ncbi:MAG: LruC domain-containing protein, partial [Candidatus Cloacimonadota bacterium]|nr:LruC domain-containing protein [Candidatus Cloacimonadota bacterium]
MKKYLEILTIIAIVLFSFSCDIFKSDDSSEPTNMNDLVVPDGFNYHTSQNVDVEISVFSNNEEPVPGISFRIYNKHPESLEDYFVKGATNANGILSAKVTVASYVDSLTILGMMSTITLPIINGEITYQFNGNNTFGKPFGNSTSRTRDDFLYFSWLSYNNLGVPSPMTTETISAELLARVNNALPERQNLLETHPEYFYPQYNHEIKLLEDVQIDLTFVLEGAGYKNAIGVFTYADEGSLPVDPEDLTRYIVYPNFSSPSQGGMLAGDVVNIGDNYVANTYLGTFLVANGWVNGSQVNGSRQTFYSVDNYNSESTPQYRQHQILLYDGFEDKIILGYEDLYRPYGDNDFNDAVLFVDCTPTTSIEKDSIYHLTPVIDTDGDGVPDDEDDYPEDPARAFDSFYPDENVYGTLAFEDLWPSKGDYDFNDIIIDFNVLQVTNADNELVDIKPEIKLRAIGAGYHNGFGIQFPFSVANFDSFSAQGNESIVRETDCDSAVVILFNDAFDLMSDPAGGTWVNTVESEPYIEPVTLNFSYTLLDPIPTANLTYLPPYNPFIIANGNRNKEVHLTDYPPTSKMSD